MARPKKNSGDRNSSNSSSKKQNQKPQSGKGTLGSSSMLAEVASSMGADTSAISRNVARGMNKAKNVVSANSNRQTATLALAGAGIIALVATETGRGWLRAAYESVSSIFTDAIEGEDSDSQSIN